MKLTITTYKELEANLHAFRDGHLKFLIIYGDAGLSKSYHVKHTCTGIHIIKCHVSPLGLYTTLYEQKDDPIFMDDLDEIYNDKICVKILKAATESDDKRLVSWTSTVGSVRDAGDPDDGRVPNEFFMTGPILLVSNDWSLHSANLKALGDRGRLIHFRPSPAEVHQQVATWFKDKEILNFIGSFIPHLTHLSMRVYVNAVAAKKAVKSGLDWRQDVRQELNIDPVTVTIMELLQDKSLSQNQRAKKFTAITGHDRTTYFRRLKAMRLLETNATLPLVAKWHDNGNPAAANGEGQPESVENSAEKIACVVAVNPTVAPLPEASAEIPQAGQTAAKPVDSAYGKKLLTISPKELKKAVAAAAVGIDGDEYAELFDNVAFFFTKNGLAITGTNNRKAARVRIPPETASYVQDDTKILVNCKRLMANLKTLETKAKVEVYADDNYLTVLVVGMQFASVRILMPPAENRDKYPPCWKDLSFDSQIEILSKSQLIAALKAINKQSVVARIKAEAGGTQIKIHGQAKQEPVVVDCAVISNGLNNGISLDTDFLIESLRHIEGEKVVLMINSEKKRVALRSDNPNHFFVTQWLKDTEAQIDTLPVAQAASQKAA